jgi:hypothetical protein
VGILLLLGFPTITSTAVLMAQSSKTPVAEGPPSPLRKGALETSIIGGTTLPISLFRAHKDRHLTMAALQIGRVLTRHRGERPFGGNFELMIEAAPLVVLRQPEQTLGITVSPLHLRWNFRPSARPFAAVFAEASGGIIYTNRDVPARTTNFNFIDQAGFGVRFLRRGKHALMVGYRFQHISNGGRVRPNPGTNFNFIYTGLTILH